MKLFRIQHTEHDEWFGTLADAKARVRQMPKYRYDEMVVGEIDVRTDKEGVLAMLNDEPLFKPLRTFGVTPRGALKEEKYYLYGNVIAQRILDEDMPFFVAQRLEGKVVRRPLEFSWAGWFTTTTARHLRALGVNASVSGRCAFFDGKCIDPEHAHLWFTREEIERMQPWVDPEIEGAAARP